MNPNETVRLLAQLVHDGALDARHVQDAFASGDAVAHLIAAGHVTREQWDEWLATAGGTRPVLTRYEVGELLGEGGEARVYDAVDRQTGERVALKVLRPALSSDPKARARFIAEAKLLIELDCENIVKGYRVAREGETIFSAMEVIEGVNLQDRLADDGPLDEDTALRVVREAATGLAHLHDRGLVHRDIKPGNLMLGDDGRVVLIDLGFAIAGSGGANAAADAATTAGTVHYISPEQARGQEGLDVRADIYSLGATLYHLLIGNLPFSGASGEEVMAKQVLEALSGEEIRAKDLSPQVHWLIEKMMAKEKEIRFQDPRALAADVDAVLQQRASEAELERERPTLGRRPGAARRGERRSTRRRRR